MSFSLELPLTRPLQFAACLLDQNKKPLQMKYLILQFMWLNYNYMCLYDLYVAFYPVWWTLVKFCSAGFGGFIALIIQLFTFNIKSYILSLLHYLLRHQKPWFISSFIYPLSLPPPPPLPMTSRCYQCIAARPATIGPTQSLWHNGTGRRQGGKREFDWVWSAATVRREWSDCLGWWFLSKGAFCLCWFAGGATTCVSEFW